MTCQDGSQIEIVLISRTLVDPWSAVVQRRRHPETASSDLPQRQVPEIMIPGAQVMRDQTPFRVRNTALVDEDPVQSHTLLTQLPPVSRSRVPAVRLPAELQRTHVRHTPVFQINAVVGVTVVFFVLSKSMLISRPMTRPLLEPLRAPVNHRARSANRLWRCS
jgi:hypothetical protein